MASIIVHGGAGAIEDARVSTSVAGVERAARVGYAVLERGGSALDAVEAAVRDLEDDPEFNAGYGSVLNRLGIVETDASIMVSAPDAGKNDLRAGAVAAVPWFRHPVTLARRVMETGEHVMLVGGGALLFAREIGMAGDPPESMVAPRAKERHERESAVRSGGGGSRSGGTVGACAVDGAGRVAAATSTGGMPWKRPGRVGDSPVVGAGNCADARAGAASATGDGESILRVSLTRGVLDRMRAGALAEAAAQGAIRELVERTGGDAGVIVVAPDGRVAHFTSTPRMPWAAIVSGRVESGADQ